MQHIELGKSGINASRISLGCMSFGGIFGPTTEAESHETLARAFDLGITHLDVADIYGMGISETVIGNFLAQNPRKCSIATKAGIVTQPQRRFDNSRDYLTNALDASLKRLKKDHVDLFYIHRRDETVPMADVMETLTRFIEAGKISAIGFSEIAPWVLEEACRYHPVAALQSEYSLWTRQPELGAIQACKRLGVTFVPFSPLGRGIFGSKPVDAANFRDIDFRKTSPRFVEPHLSANNKMVDGLRAYAADHGWKLPALAVAWVLARVPECMAIPATRTPAHLDEFIEARDIQLTPRHLEEIEAILPAGFAHGHRYSPAQAIGSQPYC
ncbi:MAG: aldo/keto reductase [Ahrensia sp.]|nr:aldo/keto reductase [Ahrensia sp.]